MFTDITNDKKKKYEITTPGEHIFYFENKNDEIIFDIRCPKAKVFIYGIYQCKNNTKQALSLTQTHTASHAQSTSIIKSVLYDKSTFTFTGIIHIKKNAHKTVAHLTNHNLLLSTKAHATTQPQMAVVPGDVVCTHAATVTSLDKEKIDYLLSRGITAIKAKELLIKGFINELSHIKHAHDVV